MQLAQLSFRSISLKYSSGEILSGEQCGQSLRGSTAKRPLIARDVSFYLSFYFSSSMIYYLKILI